MKLKRVLLAASVGVAAMMSASAANAANVLIVTGGFYTPDLKNQLIAKGHTVTEAANYSAASLNAYDAVVQDGNSFVDQSALTTYVTAGGRLILTPWSGVNYAVQSQLQIFTNGGTPVFSQANPGVNVLAPGDAFLAGVTFPAAGAPLIGRIQGISFVGGVNQVASWADGTGMLGYKSLGTGDIVGLNMHVITSDTAYTVVNTPWASQLMSNLVGGNQVAGVPEPATWAMMFLGFFGVGYSIRRKPKVTARISFA